jgi:hypothetical protein
MEGTGLCVVHIDGKDIKTNVNRLVRYDPFVLPQKGTDEDENGEDKSPHGADKSTQHPSTREGPIQWEASLHLALNNTMVCASGRRWRNPAPSLYDRKYPRGESMNYPCQYGHLGA